MKLFLIAPNKSYTTEYIPAVVDDNNVYRYLSRIPRTDSAVNSFRAKYNNIVPSIVSTKTGFASLLRSVLYTDGTRFSENSIANITTTYFNPDTIITPPAPQPVPDSIKPSPVPIPDAVTPDNVVDNTDKSIILYLAVGAAILFFLMKGGKKRGKGKKR
jgi:hypothetical protein